MTPAVSVSNISKRYRIGGNQELGYKTVRDAFSSLFRKKSAGEPTRTFWALRDVSFEVEEGEAIGIIGKNGAGKSTLLKILSRVTEPTSGRARLHGRVASLLEVGTGFHPELTGRENIYLNGAILGMSRAEVKKNFDAIVDFSEVEAFLDTPVKRYSSGMYVRLAFAVAAHLDPEILIVDEVLAVGDVGFQRKCLEKMSEESREGRTVLFVSHNMAAIRTLCQTAIWIDGGRLRGRDTSERVVDDYLRNASSREWGMDFAEQIAALPPDPVFQITRVEILQAEAATRTIQSDLPMEIEISFSVSRDTPGLHVYVSFLDLDGVLLFETLHNGDSDEQPVVRAGQYRSRVRIPPDFLAARSYQVQVNAGIHNVRVLLPAPLHSVVQALPSPRFNQAYPGYQGPGRIAPLLKWDTAMISSPVPSGIG